MLNSDLCLAFEGNDAPLLASEQSCCAWIAKAEAISPTANNGGIFCGKDFGRRLSDELSDLNQPLCCAKDESAIDHNLGKVMDCGHPAAPTGPGYTSVLAFASDESLWIEKFQAAWTKSVENGHWNLKSLESTGVTFGEPFPAAGTTVAVTTTSNSTTTATTTVSNTTTTATTTPAATTEAVTTVAPGSRCDQKCRCNLKHSRSERKRCKSECKRCKKNAKKDKKNKKSKGKPRNLFMASTSLAQRTSLAFLPIIFAFHHRL